MSTIIFFLSNTILLAYNHTMLKSKENIQKNKKAQQIIDLVSDLYNVDGYYQQTNQIALSLRARGTSTKIEKLLRDRLKLAGYSYKISNSDSGILLLVNPKRKLYIPRLNIILFIATLLSVYFVPVFYFNLAESYTVRETLTKTFSDLAAGRGLEFTLAMISILLTHEMGHFIAGRRRGIITSWPYFIPAPNIIGTFGAVIKSKSPFRNRRDLLEVGAAGPIAGWVVALGWLIYGLSESIITHYNFLMGGGFYMTLDGESILIRILAPMLTGDLSPGQVYLFSEAAFAGWVGLLVTALNMLPIGQLDGGHVLYGLWHRRQHYLGWIAMGALILLGMESRIWWMFAIMGLVLGVPHTPTLNDKQKPTQVAVVMGWISLVILLLSFTPVPFQR